MWSRRSSKLSLTTYLQFQLLAMGTSLVFQHSLKVKSHEFSMSCLLRYVCYFLYHNVETVIKTALGLLIYLFYYITCITFCFVGCAFK
jgi:hypothetical protein